MKITFLGTNGWYSTQTGSTVCTLLETKEYYIIFDAGEGFYKLNEYITKDLPVYLFLSHVHLDHIFGLHILARMNFKDKLTVIVPENKYEEILKVIGSPFTIPIEQIVKSIVPIGIGKATNLPFPYECQKLEHQDESFGFRVTMDEKVVAYCLDTGYCNAVASLAKNCDVLIHECTNKPGQKDAGWGHANPEEAAQIAKAATAKKLFLTHFMPDFYPDEKSRKTAEEAAKKIFENSVAAMNEMSVEI